MVFYHGKAGWSVAEGLGAMIATDDPELVFLPGERFILRVLTALPSEDLSRDAALKAGLIALAHRAIECFEMMAEGLERGLERGKAEVLMRLMERRFGPLSRTVRDRIAGAGPDELDAWFDRILDADDLEAMFDVSSQH